MTSFFVVFPPFCGASSAKCFLFGHHFLTKIALIRTFANWFNSIQITLQIFSTTHSIRRSCPTKWRSYCDHRYVTSFRPMYMNWLCADMPGRREEQYFDAYGPIPIIEVTYDVHVRRRPLYYVIYMILPTTVISFISLLAFLLPSDSGEKIGLGQCILLTDWW